MGLKELYLSDTYAWKRTMGVGTVAEGTPTERSPKDQASGTVGVNFAADTYQKEFAPRTFGNKRVELETDPAKTKGRFVTTTALPFFTSLVDPQKSLNYLNTGMRLTRYVKFTPIKQYTAQTTVSNTPGNKYISVVAS
jgi:hypothetical protein